MTNQIASSAARESIFNMMWPPEMDASHLLDALTDRDLDESLLEAAIEGATDLVKALWARRGPRQMHYRHVENQGFLNDLPVTIDPALALRLACEPGEVKAVFQLIHDIGITGLIEPGSHYPLLFCSEQLFLHINIAREEMFSGELPSLDNGVLRSPELAALLTEESKRSWSPQAYQPMLCWASEAMLAQYSDDLVPIHPLQRIYFENIVSGGAVDEGGSSVLCESMAEFKAANRNPDQVSIKNIELGLEFSESSSIFSRMLPNYFFNSEMSLGFADPQSRVLCETRADFLMQFAHIPSNGPDNFSAAERFVKDYFPLDVVALQTLEVCVDQFDLPAGIGLKALDKSQAPCTRYYGNQFSSFIAMLDEGSVVREAMVQMLTLEQWKAFIIERQNGYLTASSLIAFRDLLGMSNEGLPLALHPDECHELHKANYSFVNGTAVFDQESRFERCLEEQSARTCVYPMFTMEMITSFLIDRQSSLVEEGAVLEEAKQLHRMLQEMSLWSSQEPAPKDVQEAMDKICEVNISSPDFRHGMALCAYLQAKGIEACVRAAKTPMHWHRITELFSAKETQPYLKRMPRDSRGRVLEGSLGL
jgi:hypothetical protein